MFQIIVLVLSALLAITAVANLTLGFKARRPLTSVVTKEKVLALLIALVAFFWALSVPAPDAAEYKQMIEAEKQTAYQGKPAFSAWSRTVDGVPGAAAEVPVPPLNAAKLVATLTADYEFAHNAKPLFWKRGGLAAVGPVRLTAPQTPGIRILSGYAQGGPRYRYLPNRRDLGVLVPLRWDPAGPDDD